MFSILVDVGVVTRERVRCLPSTRKTNTQPTSVQESGVLRKVCPCAEGPVGWPTVVVCLGPSRSYRESPGKSRTRLLGPGAVRDARKDNNSVVKELMIGSETTPLIWER